MRLGAVVLDSGNSEELSDFYANLLGWKKHRQDGEWIIVSDPCNQSTPLVFQEVGCYKKPVWPSSPRQQQQMIHLDFYTEDVEQSVAHALSCGAVLSAIQLEEHWRVLLDPAGHPFCILPATPPA